ncbi:MAG: molybdopterin-binding protein, partial [Bacteroidota bacterium]
MKAEIITIGDEILIGQTIDSNSAWIGEELSKIGIEVNRITSIKDEPSEIVNASEEAFERVDLVLMTGGLGPTLDDKTKRTLTDHFEDELEMNRDILERIESWFKAKGLPVLEVNRQQAMLPSKAKILQNLKGSAAGMWFERDEKVLISMPGVPYEMKHILEHSGLDEIKSHFKTLPVYHKTVLTTGMGESLIADRIEDWEHELRSSGLALAYLPSPGLVKIRISAKGSNFSEIKMKVDQKANELKDMLADIYFGENKDKLEIMVGDLLREKGKNIATAESCTGGYIAHLLTSVPGSSA